MFFDLNFPVVHNSGATTQVQIGNQKKGKGKQPSVAQSDVVWTPAQLAKIENRVDLLVRLGYCTLAFNQIVSTKVDPKTHVNILDSLLQRLRKRTGVLYLKRLTIILTEESEKGFGLTTAQGSLFTPYDIISLQPTTQASFSLTCLSHTTASPLSAHIISLPLTGPRLPFYLKHTLVRTAIKNGAVFEIDYSGALRSESERRNWWASARELVRVTKGKGILVSGGAENDLEVRAPRDVGNLITLLDLPPNLSHDSLTTTPKSLILRTQTRKTYRSIFSEPVLIMPSVAPPPISSTIEDDPSSTSVEVPSNKKRPSEESSDLSLLHSTGDNTGNVDGGPKKRQKKDNKQKKKQQQVQNGL